MISPRSHRPAKRCRRRSSDDGASAVEFALVSVLLFSILFGLIQYGLYFWSLQSGSSAAREGARRAAVGDLDCTNFRTYVKERVQGETNAGDITRTYANADGTPVSPAVVGGVVTVTVTFTSIDLGFPFVPFIDDGKVSEEAFSRVENVDPTNSVDCS
ncbi:MAG: TadE family protein [Nocardioidaceae bacterium]